jgi:hypothetical protein
MPLTRESQVSGPTLLELIDSSTCEFSVASLKSSWVHLLKLLILDACATRSGERTVMPEIRSSFAKIRTAVPFSAGPLIASHPYHEHIHLLVACRECL